MIKEEAQYKGEEREGNGLRSFLRAQRVVGSGDGDGIALFSIGIDHLHPLPVVVVDVARDVPLTVLLGDAPSGQITGVGGGVPTCPCPRFPRLLNYTQATWSLDMHLLVWYNATGCITLAENDERETYQDHR
jgi:hypothetical protein